ncbi:SapC family protein [Ferrimonas marina]|uniref:SapC protein n=1 Tax=Ferrimonas marina TaxID=299255 RepID=A0A1M5YCN8_9GAMM|nr:SapC family protein [Ferrimonas marina]SHI09787.1 SapC protein [Ferrimonas marina]
MSAAAIIPLQKGKHANTKIKQDPSFAHVSEQHIAPLVIHEFVQAATEYPIIFVKNSESGQFQPVVMLGLKPGENLFVGERWKGIYIPASIGHYPLILVPDAQNPDQLMLAVNESSALVNEEEGEALFTEAGEPTAFTEKAKEKLGRYLESDQITRAFAQLMNEMELLTTKPLAIRLNGQEITLNGVYMVDEQKLAELEDDKFMDLRKRGLLGPIYAHLASLQQVNRLAHMKVQQES